MEETKKTAAEQLKDKLLLNSKNGGFILTQQEIEKSEAFCEGYKKFLDTGKTEREITTNTIRLLINEGYREFCPGTKYTAGDRVYSNNRGKALILATIGTAPLAQGVRIAAAHIDSPRLDLKPNPLYEDAQLALFKTHYYGGIKKYQWTAIPLALHGVIVKGDGSVVNVSIGEDENDPVFCVTDLLPHLAEEQVKRPLHQGIKGEELNILIGCMPFRDDKASETVKLNIMNILNEKYGIVEEDFLSAELEAVPAGKARDLGFDRGMVAAYGHDDRVCAYTALMAALDCKEPAFTTVTVLADKEETGSEGNTGLDSAYLKYFIADLAEPHGVNARTVLSASKCLSADVNAAFDPTFPDVLDRRNCAYLNYGVCLTKYTGSRGKSGTSDCSAEFFGEIRSLFNAEKVLWQTGELGKVDLGGGGTVAKFIAGLNVDVLDVGVPVLSMHSPLEIVSKLDVFCAYRGFYEFLNAK